MKLLLKIIITLALAASTARAIPQDAANLFTFVEVKLQQPVPGFRIQILRISPDTFVDPAPQLSAFDGQAAFTVTFQPGRHKKELSEMIERARKSKWELMSHPAYPRWCVRFVGPWNDVLDAIGIDEENQAILVGDRWYKVEKGVVDALTSDMLRVGTELKLMQ